MDIIDRYLTIITFIPWFLAYISSIIFNLNKECYRTLSIDNIKKNFWKIFRIDNLVLLICFFIFASFKKSFVNKYLFPVMCLYLFVNSFYEKTSLEKNFFKKYFWELLILFILMFIPFGFYLVQQRFNIAYKIMLCTLFLEYFLISSVCTVIRLVKKKE